MASIAHPTYFRLKNVSIRVTTFHQKMKHPSAKALKKLNCIYLRLFFCTVLFTHEQKSKLPGNHAH